MTVEPPPSWPWACEGAEWEALLEISAKLRLSEETVAEGYFKSLEWSRQVFQTGSC
jgi:hypothetical protein